MNQLGARAGVLVTAAVLSLLACKKVDDPSADDPSTADPAPGALVDANPGAPLPADAAWVARPSGVTDTLDGVWASPDASLVVAVGDRGTIVVSRDRGATWSAASSGSAANLAAVWGSGASDVYAVGAGATILHSTDGARTWTPEVLGATTDLLSIWGSGPDNVFVGGENSTVYRSRSGGETWRALFTPAITRIAGLWGTSNLELFAVAHVGLVYTQNGGDKFFNTAVSVSQQNAVWASGFRDVYTVNSLGIVTHYDGTETLKKTELTPVRSLYGVWGTRAEDVYAVGARGRIVHSSDRGESWAGQDSGTAVDLRAVHGAAGVVFAVGEGGTILARSADVRVADAGADGGS